MAIHATLAAVICPIREEVPDRAHIRSERRGRSKHRPPRHDAWRADQLQACWELDQGGRAGQATAIAKTFCAEAIWRVVDRAVQVCGSLGVSGDLPLGRFLREVRPFRIYDGPSETHR